MSRRALRNTSTVFDLNDLNVLLLIHGYNGMLWEFMFSDLESAI